MTGFVPDAGQPQATTTDSSAFSVGALAGTMMSTAAVANTQSQVQKLVDSAKSGGFAINEEGADEYIRVFRDFGDVLLSVQEQLESASQKPQLGDGPYASQVARHTQLIASGDAQSYATALDSLSTVVDQARQAFEEAKKRYAQMDDEAAQTFGGAQI